MYSPCSTYDGNNDLHDAPTRSYCSVAPLSSTGRFGHASATCQLWRSRRAASQVQRLRSLEFGQAQDRLHSFIFYYVRRALAPPPDMSLSALNPPPKCHFIIYVHCSYTPLDKQRNIYMSSVPDTCHRSCPRIIHPFSALDCCPLASNVIIPHNQLK